MKFRSLLRMVSGPTTRYLVLTSFLCVLAIELLARPSLTDVWQWVDNDATPFFLNWLIASCILALFVALFGRLVPGLAMGAAFLILAAVANRLKLATLSTPLFAWDFLYGRQILALGEAFFKSMSHGWHWVAPFVLILGGWGLYRFRGARLGWPVRAALVAITLCGVVLFNENGRFHLPRMLMLQNMSWDQPLNYRNNGFLLSFSMNISPLLIRQPEAYDAELVARLMAHNQEIQQAPEGYRKRPVSLVILMSESFSYLPGVPFTTSENPWENMQRLSAQYPSFQIISPTFGGNTSVVEFELLTGLSYALLPNGSVPYDHYLKHPVPSLASILRQSGYHTVAVHPFYPWFWSRSTAYENLGFDQFISIDDFKDPELKGLFVSDKSFVDKIIEVFETRKDKAPIFVHAVSMQNHMPYDHGEVIEDRVAVEGEMDDRLRKSLSTYLTGIRDADRELARLLQYLEKRKEPVICLFFGDHQPVLAMELSQYRTEKPVTTIASDYQLAEVPGLIWSNRDDLVDAADIPQSLSPSHLPALLLHQMGIALPGHLFHMWQGMQSYPVIHRRFVQDPSGALVDFKQIASDPWFKDLEVLQYDLLFGKGYATTPSPPTKG